MADVREVFTTLQDYTDGSGQPLHRALEGDDITSRNAHGALVAKNSADEFQYLLVNDLNELVVSLESGAYALLSNTDTHAGDITYQTVASITLQNDLVYKEVEIIASCYRDAKFQLILSDDAVETVLIEGMRVGAGSFNFSEQLKSLEFTTGLTGTQLLLLKGKNQNVISDMDGFLAVKEIQ